MTNKYFLIGALSFFFIQPTWAGGGNIGGPGDSTGLDALPTKPEEKPNGTVLQPPILMEDPSGTIIVRAPDSGLRITARLCKYDANGILLPHSCRQDFKGLPNQNIKVLPGKYQILASTLNFSGNTDEDTGLMVFHKPVDVRANQIVKIEMKKIDLGNNTSGVFLSPDFSDKSELNKALSAHWGSRVKVSVDVEFDSDLSSTGVNGDYIANRISNFIEALCNEDEPEFQKIREKVILSDYVIEPMQKIILATANILTKKFKTDAIWFRRLCPQSRYSGEFDDWAARFQVSRINNETIGEPSIKYGVPFKSIFSVQYPKSKIVIVGTEKKEVSDIVIGPTLNLSAVDDIGGIFLQRLQGPTFVFPGKYVVVYRFKAPWPNEEKTLEKVQYGIEIK